MPERDANIERIIDWIEGRLSPDEQERTASEVAADPAARTLAGLYRAARTTIAGDRSEAPSDALMQRLRAIGAGSTAEAPAGVATTVAGRLAAFLRDMAAVPRGVAELIHDSRRPQPGLRGAATADAPAFLAAYADGGVEIELQVERGSADWSVIGQVSRPDVDETEADRVLEIRCRRLDASDPGDADEQRPAVGDDGVFETTLVPGVWAIAAVLPDRIVIIEELSLGDPADAE